MGVMRRFVLGVLAASLLAGCGQRTATPARATPQILLIGNKDEPDDLDPATNNGATTSTLLSALFDGLVKLGNDGETILPGMAERWEISPDGLTYTFHLRSDAVWSNGQPVTAEEFRLSFLRAIDPQVGSQSAYLLFPVVGAQDFAEGRLTDPAKIGLSAPDAHTFVMKLIHPAPYWLIQLTSDPFYPLNIASLDATNSRRTRGGPWTRPGNMISNGPFTLAEWRPNAFVRVVKNPRYWDTAQVRLSEVRFYPTDDENAEERAYRAGQLHVTYRVPTTKIPVYEKERPAELHIAPLFRTDFLALNTLKAPFNDARVRRAFSLAIDRKEAVRAVLGRLAEPAFALSHPGINGYTPPNLFRYDPVEARRLLAEAGFPGGKGLPEIELTLNGNAGRIVDFAQVLQEMWVKNLGVQVSVSPVEFKVYLSLSREKQFQIMLEGWTSTVPDARDLLALQLTGNPNNDVSWSNPDYDAAFADSDQTGDPARRAADFDRMEKLLANEVPYAPLYYANQGFLVSPQLHGWRDNALHWVDWRTLSLEEK